MIDLTKLLLITDTDTLKNDDSGTANLIVPASATVAGSGYGEWYVDLTLSTDATASVVTYFSNTQDSTKSYLITHNSYLARTGVNGGLPAAYSLAVAAERINGTTMRFKAFVVNPYASTLTLSTTADNFTFLAKSFNAPF